ncbi:transporter substrate-binding domain-containing protein, partial [Candidatus Riflebacteria bacterium]
MKNTSVNPLQFTISITLSLLLIQLMVLLFQPTSLSAKEPGKITLTAEEKSWLKTHREIRVHNETAWAPFNFNEGGKPKGLSIDYMNLLAERIGIKINYISGPSWGEFLGMIKKKELDIMLNIVKTEDRQKYLLYTEPYTLNPNMIVSRKANRYEKIEELYDKTVAFPKGFFYEEVLKKNYPQIKRLPVKDTFESLKAVSFGKADAALGENAVFHHFISKNLMTDLAGSGEVDIGNPDFVNLRLGIRNDWKIFHAIIVKAMASVSREENNELRQKWLFTGDKSQKLIDSFTDEEKAWLKAHPKIRVHNETAWAPFNFNEGGKPKGLSIDYMNLLAERIGI